MNFSFGKKPSGHYEARIFGAAYTWIDRPATLSNLMDAYMRESDHGLKERIKGVINSLNIRSPDRVVEHCFDWYGIDKSLLVPLSRDPSMSGFNT
jgi:hypothetical protein